MYFLNVVYLTRQSYVKAWPTSCHNVLKLTCASGKTPSKQLDPCRTSPVGGVHHYKDTLRHGLGPSMWTQVRFRNGHPRFHNDIEFPNFDAYRKDNYIDVRKTKWGSGDEKPGYTYFIGFLGMMGAAYSVKGHGSHYIMSMAAAADVRAMAAIEIDLTKIAPGATSSFKWRGKPLFIKNRTQADIDFEYNTPLAVLRDPESPEKRCTKPEWLIVIGICTHLGCVPVPDSGDWAGGFYCPCHGSHYDNLGRARKGPAPLNLEVPPYVFVTDTLVLVG